MGPEQALVKRQREVRELHRFLNPGAAPGMTGAQYAAFKASRAEMWANFLKNNK